MVKSCMLARGLGRIIGLALATSVGLCSCTLWSSNFGESQLVNKRVPNVNVDARIYKRVNGRELELHIFYPDGYSPDSETRYPAAVNLHGGGWSEGPIEWGYGEAQFMASLGYVGIAVGYRLALSDNATALDSMRDSASAIRWVRIYADELRVDPERILAIGHSAGGHLALSTAMFPSICDEGEDMTVSSVPNKVVALAPAVDVGTDPNFTYVLNGAAPQISCSPIDNVRKLEIPMLVIYGSEDEVLPVSKAQEFVDLMKLAGNDIELLLYPGGGHLFFYEDAVGRELWQTAVMEFVTEP